MDRCDFFPIETEMVLIGAKREPIGAEMIWIRAEMDLIRTILGNFSLKLLKIASFRNILLVIFDVFCWIRAVLSR